MIEGKLKTYLIGVLRSASIRWAEKNEAFKLARIERGRYQCKMCSDLFKREQCIADHIDPVVDPHVGWVSLDSFAERLFVDRSKYQILCRTCSDIKTMVEDEIRKAKTVERNEKKKEVEKEAKRVAKELKKKAKDGTV